MSSIHHYSNAPSSELYITCMEQNGGDTMRVLGCVAAGLENSLHKVKQANEAANVTLHSWLLVIAGAMVFFMQVRCVVL